jgi:hypothetical protein
VGNAVTGSDEQDDIGDAIGEFIKNFAGLCFPSAFDCHQTIEQIADEPKLNAEGSCDEKQASEDARLARREDQAKTAKQGEDKTGDGNLVWSEATSNERKGQLAWPICRTRF